jgi:hypothetical protein
VGKYADHILVIHGQRRVGKTSGKHEDLKETKRFLPKFKRKYWPLMADIAKELSFEFAAAGTMELIKVLM